MTMLVEALLSDISTITNALTPFVPYAVFGIGGFVLGKMLRLVFKIIAIIAGMIILMIGGLWYMGLITLNPTRVESTIINAAKIAADQGSDMLHYMQTNFVQNDNMMLGGSIFFLVGIGFGIRK